ncbi:MAG: type III pantothenate kinase [Gammaproteobacteria bacterium]|jgi:type III pantothenate kinase|nr:type III pantothenate kinase [Gammaproteobacteria bacterium]MBT4608103.1 type III pantothenate kinase [Thiotrichales bacterium]MBT3471815.1 type III pantothenate kinase [Gammaproteobacteria bacterium]MBT3967700.1 type III pantothenate kinase [Gammaproteobacteria bacterium]MBT4328505.1 type III pantothenate kinase [Gammaproteobacteria bacterium]
MRRLLIDSGNSRVKWGWGGESGVESTAVVDAEQLEQLPEYWRRQSAPNQVWMVNSAGQQREQQLQQWVQQCWALQPQIIQSAEQWGALTNGYANPQQLGVDRWLGMVAAWQRTKGAFCLIDCGTAVTLDFVDTDGEHQGGLILPAVGSTLQTLLQRAPHLKAHYREGQHQLLLGRTTEEALKAAEHGVGLMLNEVLVQLESRYGLFGVWLTGGAAEKIQQELSAEAEVASELVLEGVDLWASS